MTKQLATSLAYGFVLGLAVGIVLESSGALLAVDAAIGRLIRKETVKDGRPGPEAERAEPAAGD